MPNLLATPRRYTFPAGTINPRILVDITNDGQQSSTDPVMFLNDTSGRITGEPTHVFSVLKPILTMFQEVHHLLHHLVQEDIARTRVSTFRATVTSLYVVFVVTSLKPEPQLLLGNTQTVRGLAR